MAAAKAPRWVGPTDDELAALDALGAKGIWELQGHELALTNLDKVLFPGRDGEDPLTKRDLIRYHARVAPFLLPYLHDRAVNLHRFPNGVDKAGFWHKEVPSHAPEWLTRWHYDEARADDTQWYFVVDQVRGPGVDGQLRRRRAAPLDLGHHRAPPPHVGADRHRPRHPHHLRGGARAGPALPGRPRAPRGGGPAQGHRQAGRPDLGAGHADATPSTQTRDWVEKVSRAVGADGARAGELEVAHLRAGRAGPARLHPERHQQDAGGPVQRPAGRRARRCRCRSGGTSSTTPSSPPTAGRSARCSTAWPRSATPWPAWSGWPRSSPSSSRDGRRRSPGRTQEVARRSFP